MDASLASNGALIGVFLLLLVAAALVVLLNLVAVVLIGVGTFIAGVEWAFRAITGLGRSGAGHADSGRVIPFTRPDSFDHLRPAA